MSYTDCVGQSGCKVTTPETSILPLHLQPDPELGVYVCNKFTGHYPVPTAAAVVARSQQHAAELLNEQLRNMGLPGDADANMMALMIQSEPQAVILSDGNY